MGIIDVEYEAQTICIRLYHGWVEKNEIPVLSQDVNLYRLVQEKLSWLGLELIDRPECRWYLVRLRKENDSFAQYRRRNLKLHNSHLALILILYTKLLLPRRVGQVGSDTELLISFQEIYQKFGNKFARSTRNPTSEGRMLGLIKTIIQHGFIVKKRKEEVYFAGPAMYMLHEELLNDVAEASLEILYGLESYRDSDSE